MGEVGGTERAGSGWMKWTLFKLVYDTIVTRSWSCFVPFKHTTVEIWIAVAQTRSRWY